MANDRRIVGRCVSFNINKIKSEEIILYTKGRNLFIQILAK